MSGDSPVCGVTGARWAVEADGRSQQAGEEAAGKANLLMSCLIGRAYCVFTSSGPFSSATRFLASSRCSLTWNSVTSRSK